MDYELATTAQREAIRRGIHWMMGKDWYDGVSLTVGHDMLNRADASTLIQSLHSYATNERGVMDNDIKETENAEKLIKYIVSLYV